VFRRPTHKLESALYFAIFGVLAAVLLDRLLAMGEFAERAAMQSTIARLQAGLYLRLAESVTVQRQADVRGWDKQNPFELAKDRPHNYLGERANPRPTDLAQGFWFFDTVSKEIVYVPQQYRLLDRPRGDPPALRFRLRLDGVSPAGIPAQMTFEPAEPIVWGRRSGLVINANF